FCILHLVNPVAETDIDDIAAALSFKGEHSLGRKIHFHTARYDGNCILGLLSRHPERERRASRFFAELALSEILRSRRSLRMTPNIAIRNATLSPNERRS
ncbi:MAG: hypothetical protein KAS83_01330, partial [Dehalococcoidia bacterium]|nr:hypothetical protein [Dehalococcoidia bacterium]